MGTFVFPILCKQQEPSKPPVTEGVSWGPLRQKKQQSVWGGDWSATSQVTVARPFLCPGPCVVPLQHSEGADSAVDV